VLLLGFLVIAAAMLWNTGLSTYHAGIEWKWWPGPAECTGPINTVGTAKDLLNQLNTFSPVRCDEAQWRFLGLSLAGYDVLVSFALAVVALWGAKAAYMRRAD
jgi:disulfide bond formation protein DsbB